MRNQLAAIAILAYSVPAYADDVTYQRPVKAVANFVDAPAIPQANLGPDRSTLVLVTPIQFPSITEVAEPELRLAGLRINPKNRAMARRGFAQRLELLDVTAKAASPRPIRGLPDGARIGDVQWSPDGKSLAFTVTEADAIRLWLADVHDATARAIATPPLSGVAGRPCDWLPDSRTLVCRTVPAGVKPPPTAPTVPTVQIPTDPDRGFFGHRRRPPRQRCSRHDGVNHLRVAAGGAPHPANS